MCDRIKWNWKGNVEKSPPEMTTVSSHTFKVQLITKGKWQKVMGMGLSKSAEHVLFWWGNFFIVSNSASNHFYRTSYKWKVWWEDLPWRSRSPWNRASAFGTMCSVLSFAQSCSSKKLSPHQSFWEVTPWNGPTLTLAAIALSSLLFLFQVGRIFLLFLWFCTLSCTCRIQCICREIFCIWHHGENVSIAEGGRLKCGPKATFRVVSWSGVCLLCLSHGFFSMFRWLYVPLAVPKGSL